MGVVLFTLLCGYPPFKTSDVGDKWYGYLAKKDYQSFWRAHRNCGLSRSETDLVTRMLLRDPRKRIGLGKLQEHAWLGGEVLSAQQLVEVLTYRHQVMSAQMAADPKKQEALQHSVRVTRPILPHFAERIAAKGMSMQQRARPLPPNVRPDIYRDVYTQCDAYEVLQEMKLVIEDEMQGVLVDANMNRIFEDEATQAAEQGQAAAGEIDIDNFCLTATIAQHVEARFQGMTIHVQLYWDERRKSTLVRFKVLERASAARAMDFWGRKQMLSAQKKLQSVLFSKARHVLYGPPEDKAKESVGKEVQQLYSKCFPDKKK